MHKRKWNCTQRDKQTNNGNNKQTQNIVEYEFMKSDIWPTQLNRKSKRKQKFI